MRLRAIQQPGNAGALLDSFIRAAGNLPCDCRELSRARELTPTLEKLALRSLEDGHEARGDCALPDVERDGARGEFTAPPLDAHFVLARVIDRDAEPAQAILHGPLPLLLL